MNEQDSADFARAMLARAQTSLDDAALAIDRANRTLMEMGAPGWHLADAWNYASTSRATIDKHIETYFQHEPRTSAERVYRAELAKLLPERKP